MGDRANIRLIQPDNKGSIYIYTHGGGYNFPRDLQHALAAAKGRWVDKAYFNHIVIDQLTKGNRDSEYGSGISLDRQDNEYNIIEVDLDAKTVAVRSDAGWHDAGDWEATSPLVAGPIPYADYIALVDPVKWREGV